MRALRGFLRRPRLWGRFGFVDAFSDQDNWYARTYLAVNQGPIVAMMENYRSGLLWKLFMRSREAQDRADPAGIRKVPGWMNRARQRRLGRLRARCV